MYLRTLEPRRPSHLLHAIAAAASLAAAGRDARASYPVLTDVTAAVVNQQVRYEVLNPKSGNVKAGEQGPFSTIGGLSVKDGVVSWFGKPGPFDPLFVYCAVFEPSASTSGTWKTWTSPALNSVFALTSNGGVVAFGGQENLLQGASIYTATYDVAKGSSGLWTSDVSGPYGASGGIVVKDGIVAWWAQDVAFGAGKIHSRIYDPLSGSGNWRGYDSPAYSNFAGPAVSGATVTWTGDGSNQKRGYRPSTHSWFNGNSESLSHFVPSVISGPEPLWVWIADASLGATSWSWSFGDGGSSGVRSTYHSYASGGVFALTSSVANPSHSNVSQQSITVGSAGTLQVSPAALSFVASAGGPNPAPQSFTVANTGSLPFSYSLLESSSWLSLAQSGGVAPPSGQPMIAIDAAGLAPGSYDAVVDVVAPGVAGSPASVQVHLDVTAGPTLSVQPGSLSFSGSAGGSSPAPQTLHVENAGTGTFAISATAAPAWLHATPSAAPSVPPALDISVTIESAGLAPGVHAGVIVVSALGAANSPLVIPVALELAAPTWTDLGDALPGSGGPAVLAGQGALAPGSAAALDLSNAAPSALCFLLGAPTPNPTPLLGGTLVPAPTALFLPYATDAAGTLHLPFTCPTPMPSAFAFVFQFAVSDASAVFGVALSNALAVAAP